MKITTVEQEVNATESLNWLSTEELPTNYSFMVKRLLRAITPESQAYEAERIQTLEKYGERSEDGGNFVIPTEDIEKFNEAMAALFAVEIELPDTAIPSSLWEKIEPIRLIQLDWLIEEVEPND